MTRVLLLSPTATAGGAERAFAGLAKALPAFGYEPTAVLLETGPLARWLEDAGCSVVTIPAGRTRHVHTTARTLARLLAAIRRLEASIVVSSQSKGHVLGGIAAALSGTPNVWWQHGVADDSMIERIARRVPASIVVCGSDHAVEAQKRGTPASRIRRIYPGTEIGAIMTCRGRGERIRQQLGWQDQKLVGIVGRLQPWKGQETFLRAAALVAQKYPAARFLVIGGAILGREGSYPDDLQRLGKDPALIDRVRFTGHRNDVWDWCDALDVVVHASTGEPFGLVVVEAMALGKPVVAAADGGPLEIVEDGVSGLLTPPGDHDALARAIGRLLDDPDFAEALAARAELRAGDFSIEHTASSFAAVLDEVVRRNGGA